jgi:aminoglycoside phosphotransferase family enzyme
MVSSYLPDYIRHLLKSSSYPHDAENVELLQTHVSYLIFAGKYVYKWKKQVDFGFLDFSTPAKRQFYCEEELRLNRRLCPEVYLETVGITVADGNFSLNGPGKVLEYGVKMLRLPEAMMMEKVLAEGKLRTVHLTKIVEILVPFYAAAAIDEPDHVYGTAAAIGTAVRDNFAQTSRFVGGEALSSDRFALLQEFTDDFLANEEMFEQRRISGCTRECHGDLHSGNICLDQYVHIFDCIEFNKSLRCIDIAADLAFLAMDLDFHNRPDLSQFFIDSFVNVSGDTGLRSVLNFYKCYRAYVRGKIGLLTSADPGVGKDVSGMALQRAGKYFQLAEKYATA